MQFNQFNVAVEEGDKYDSVTYAQGNTKKYWFPNQINYRFWEGKKANMLWNDIDYTKLLDNYHRDFSKLFLLIQCINDKNILVDSNNKPLRNNKQIAESIGLKYNRINKQFFKELHDKNILKKDKDKKLIYLSPFVSMRKYKLYIGCYKMFREELLPYLTTKQKNDLDKHMTECIDLGLI